MAWFSSRDSSSSSSDCESLPDIEDVPPIAIPQKPKITSNKRPTGNDMPINGNGPSTKSSSSSQAPAEPAKKRRRILPVKKRKVKVKSSSSVDVTVAEEPAIPWPATLEHPLCNELIVEEIERHLPLKDLKLCRRVSKLWNHFGVKYMKELHPPIRFRNSGKDELSLFIRAIQDSSDFPFTRFQIDSNTCPENIPWFFKHYGSKVLHLILSYKDQEGDYSLSSEHLQLIIKEIKNVEVLELISLPRHLTEKPLFRSGRNINKEPKLLKLSTLRFDEDYEMCYSVGFLQDLFYITPNCTQVQLNMLYDPVTISRFFTSMKIMNKRPAFSRIDISHSMRETQIHSFNQIGLQLKDLKLENVELVDECEGLQSLLTKQSETLESLFLCLGTTTKSRVVAQPMPVMKKLQQLSLYFPVHFGSERGGSQSQFPLCQDPCLNQFPNLKTLRTSSDVFQSFFTSSFATYSTVNSLNITVTECDEKALVETIARIFPELKPLWIVFCSARAGKGFAPIFQNLKNLEHLKVEYFGFGNINNFLIGEPLLEEKANMDSQLQDTVNPASFGIQNMKKLLILHIASVNCKISEISAVSGFLQIPPLVRLTLRNVQIGEECLAQLEGLHGRVEILNS